MIDLAIGICGPRSIVVICHGNKRSNIHILMNNIGCICNNEIIVNNIKQYILINKEITITVNDISNYILQQNENTEIILVSYDNIHGPKLLHIKNNVQCDCNIIEIGTYSNYLPNLLEEKINTLSNMNRYSIMDVCISIMKQKIGNMLCIPNLEIGYIGIGTRFHTLTTEEINSHIQFGFN